MSEENVTKAQDLEAVVEEDRRLVFGFASVAIHKGEQVLDHHNDLLDVEDLEKAAYVYNLESRAGNDMHDGPDVMQLVESMVITDEKIAKFAEAHAAVGTPEYTEALEALQKYLPRALWVGYYVNDDGAWDAVKKGERRMFSIEGEAIREVVNA